MKERLHEAIRSVVLYSREPREEHAEELKQMGRNEIHYKIKKTKVITDVDKRTV